MGLTLQRQQCKNVMQSLCVQPSTVAQLLCNLVTVSVSISIAHWCHQLADHGCSVTSEAPQLHLKNNAWGPTATTLMPALPSELAA